MSTQREDAGMLPGTIVHNRRPDCDIPFLCWATKKCRFVEIKPREKFPYGLDVDSLAVVRASSERDVDVAQAKRLHGTASNKLRCEERFGQRPQRIDGSAIAVNIKW
jgi:hypothetical protein